MQLQGISYKEEMNQQETPEIHDVPTGLDNDDRYVVYRNIELVLNVPTSAYL